MLSAEIVAHQGWDSLTVDMQHGHIDFESMVAMLTAISTTATVPLVRVPWNEPGDVMRALDAGSLWRHLSQCRYARAVRTLRRRLPLCAARLSQRRAQARGALWRVGLYRQGQRDRCSRSCRSKSALGLKNVAEIASVKSLDMIYVGPTDLALSLGRDIRAGLSDPVLMQAIDEILAAAKTAGVRTGIYCRNADDAKAMFAKGFDLATVTSDDALLAAGAAVAAKFR